MTSTSPSIEQQALAAAAPALIVGFQALQTFVNTTFTGDPLQIPLRADAAFDVFMGTVKLQFPSLFAAEVGVVQNDINTGISGVIAKLQALNPPATATPPAAAASAPA